MAYSIPTFNITCRAYTGGDITAPPRETNVACNLAWGKRVNVPSTGGTGAVGVPLMTMQLLLPLTADIRGRDSATGSDMVEVPQGSGRYYRVTFCDHIGYGFPNEHKCAILEQNVPFKTPDV